MGTSYPTKIYSNFSKLSCDDCVVIGVTSVGKEIAIILSVARRLEVFFAVNVLSTGSSQTCL
jgi:hypothetical protein